MKWNDEPTPDQLAADAVWLAGGIHGRPAAPAHPPRRRHLSLIRGGTAHERNSAWPDPR